MRSRPVQRISDVAACAPASFRKTRPAGPSGPPVDSYIEINNFYTATVYEKGAELVRMLRRSRRGRSSARAWTSTSSAMTARP
jgi:aminopeptidase N